MAFDPLAQYAQPAPAGMTNDPEEIAQRAAAERAQFDALIATARAHVSHEMLTKSAYAIMPPATLRTLAITAGFGKHHAAVDEPDIRRLMVYVDAQLVSQGRQPFATPDEPVIEEPKAPVAPVQIPSLPLSTTNQWRVMKTVQKCAMQGGVYVLREGTIVSLAEHGKAGIQGLVDQKVQLEAYPPVGRHRCMTCDTTWLDKYPDKCPLCFLTEEAEGEAASRDAVRDRMHALEDQLDALITWARKAGAASPDPDGKWGGELAPPPLPKVTAEPPPAVTAAASDQPAASASAPPAESATVADASKATESDAAAEGDGKGKPKGKAKQAAG